MTRERTIADALFDQLLVALRDMRNTFVGMAVIAGTFALTVPVWWTIAGAVLTIPGLIAAQVSLVGARKIFAEYQIEYGYTPKAAKR